MAKNKNPITWFQGMPVGPEVFQQNFIYQEETKKSLMESINPFSWGIVELEWDESNFSQGVLKIKRLKCIFPDFTFLDLTEDDGLIINFEDKKEQLKQKELFININLPNNHFTKQPNVSNPRYSLSTKEVQDLNDENTRTTITTLKHEHFLSLDESATVYVSIPLAKLTFNGMSFSLTHYLPPSLSIRNYPNLVTKVERVLDSAKNKLRYLVNKQTSLENNFTIYNLSNIANNLEAAISSKVHPFEFYKILVSLSSSAFLLSGSRKLSHIEAYEHSNCASSIEEMLNFASESVAKIDQQYNYHKFTQSNDIYAIFPKFINDKIIIGIEKKELATNQEVLEWIGKAIIASEDKISTLQDQRAKGANRSLIENYAALSIQPIQGLILVEIERNPIFVDEKKALCIIGIDDSAKIPVSSIYLFEKE